MKFLICGLLIVLLTIGMATNYYFNPHTKKVIPCPFCYQDVATATYLAFITLDCDGTTEPSGVCADDLENVNLAPRLNSVSTINRKGDVTVNLTIIEVSGFHDDFSFTFNKLGLLLS